MTRDDLRVMTSESETGDGQHKWRVFRPVSEAELAEMGLVVVPDCEACEGTGRVPCDCRGIDYTPDEPHTCPSCGGSGKGRLVNLTGIDVEELREVVAMLNENPPPKSRRLVRAPYEFARQVLAALDKGETDGT